MPATIINLSAIPGVQVYSTKAAALSAANDAGPSLLAYLNTITTSQASPLTIFMDGFAYIANQWIYTGNDGVHAVTDVYWFAGSGLTPSQCGLIWRNLDAASVTVSQMAINGMKRWATDYSDIVNQRIYIGGVTLDLNYGGTTASVLGNQGLCATGVRQLILDGTVILNFQDFATQFTRTDQVIANNVTLTAAAGATHPGFIGYHMDGPNRYWSIVGGAITAPDDSISLYAANPGASTGVIVNTMTPEYETPWLGGATEHYRIVNPVLNSYSGIRLLTIGEASYINDVVIDGVSGTVQQWSVCMDPYDDSGVLGVANLTGITIQNHNVQSGTTQTYKPGRIYVGKSTNVSGLLLDLKTCSPVTHDNVSSSPPPFFYADVSATLSNLRLSYQLPVTNIGDTFNRANGAIGNGWTDVDSVLSISGNKLIGNTDGSFHAALRETVGEVFADGRVEVLSLNTSGLYIVQAVTRAVLPYTTGTRYIATTTLNSTSSFSLLRELAATPTTLFSISSLGTGINTNLIRTEMATIGEFVFGRVTTVNTGSMFSPAVIIADQFTGNFQTANYAGIGLAGTSGHAAEVLTAAVQQFTPVPTLTSIEVGTSGVPDANGIVHFGLALFPFNASPAGLIWTTSAGFVDQFGGLWTHTLPSGGTATVTATIGSVSASAVYPVPTGVSVGTVTSVQVNPGAVQLFGGVSYLFSANVSGTGYVSQAVTWSASAGSITSSGFFTAPAATGSLQTVTITATSASPGGKSGTATVTIPATPVATPSITPAGGNVTTVDQITLATSTPLSTLRYTTDGTTPSRTNGQFYMGPFSLPLGSITLKTMAYAVSLSDSSVATQAFTVTEPS